MYVEEYFWRQRFSKTFSQATRGLNSLLKRLWDLASFRVYRDSYKLVERAVLVYGHRAGNFGTEPDVKKRVDCIVKRIVDSENAACWGVDCSHVAKYLDKSYEDYLAESSISYKILWRLACAVKNSDHELIYEALNEALEYIHSYEEACFNRQAPARPGDAARVSGDGVGEEGALP